MKVKIKDFERDVPYDFFAKEMPVNLTFGGELMVQIEYINGRLVITNAMNGYGDNCFSEYENEKIILS